MIAPNQFLCRFRSPTSKIQDFLPISRILPLNTRHAIKARKRRDRYHEILLEKLKDKIARGEDQPCIIGNILKDTEHELNNDQITSIAMSMITGIRSLWKLYRHGVMLTHFSVRYCSCYVSLAYRMPRGIS